MLKIITFLIFIALNGIHLMALPLLTVDSTFRRGNLEIDLREANSVLSGSSLEKANEIFSFFDEKIAPLIPDHLQTKISKRLIKIEFQKDLAKGALFIDNPNEAEPLLLKVRSTLVNDPSFFRLLAHEWFHALHYVVHKDEPAWLREGLAQVFEHIVLDGYNGPNLIDALENSTTPSNHKFKIDQVNREAYGHVFIYFYYLFKKCGNQPLFWKIVESQVGKFAEQTIEYALSEITSKPDYCSSFKTSLIHAELARFHNRKMKDNGITSDEYLIIPELNRSIKNILTVKNVATVIPVLEKYEPKIFQASASKALSKYLHSEEWSVFSLGQSTPYSVRVGLEINPSAMPADLIFIMKNK